MNTHTNFLSSEAILDQLPIMLGCLNLEHKFIAANKQFALLQGYNTVDKMLGSKISEIPCKAVESSDKWIAQNKELLETQTALTLLDIHPYYFDNKVIMVLAKKSPVFDNANNIIAIGLSGMEIQTQTLFNTAFQIAQADKHYRPNKNINQRSYSICNADKSFNLSKREIECLFYLVRGKSARETALCLQLSKRTIEDHIENIKYKMNCQTKSQVIEKAIENNLIDIIPDSLLENINLSVMI